MQSFLEKTADHLVKKYGDHIGELCIVLPNRRAGLFLKQYLSAKAGKTIWSPEIFSIEDLIQKLCGLQKVDNTTLLFELYAIHQEEQKNSLESFDEFAKWAQIFIQDINEIDRYLVDAKQLFGNLKNIKEIENWSLSHDNLTDFQKNYLAFFQSLGNLYEKLKEKLLAKKQCYEGLAFRIVQENLDEKIKQHNWHKIIFAGFNALNASEEKIFTALVKQGKAEILWDSDAYYVEDHSQEAGKFLRRLLPKFKNEKDGSAPLTTWEEELLSTSAKKITVIGAAKNVAQASTASGILEELNVAGTNMQETALVLADENLLFPVLHSLPDGIEDVNVTMGYPLKSTSFAGLTDILFNLHNYSKQSKKDKENDLARFYHKELLKLLAHPYIKFLFSNGGLVQHLRRTIIERNYVFISSQELERLLSEEQKSEFNKFKFLLSPWEKPEEALNCLEDLIEMLRSQFANEKDRSSIETEYIFGFSKIFKRVKTLLQEYETDLEIKTLHSVIKQIISATTLPFYGEPLSGLQVMGVLETRTLDFKNVIMLSVNENVIPSAKTQNSFIPFDLKKAFDLPTYSDKDAVFAYHFYRLLQRAENIYLLYNTEADEFGKGEKSRFITQLLYELPRKNPNITIEEKLAVTENAIATKDESIHIKKSKEVLEILDKKAVKGFSPSALNTYKNCALQFYFQQIANLREANEVEETIGADTLGTAIHEVLEELYKPFLKKIVHAEDISAMKKDVERFTENEFNKLYSSHELKHGKNLLTLRIAVKFINNFLDAELKFVEKIKKENKFLTILELEKPLEYSLKIEDKNILLHGNADRIDSVGGITRIIDYKTGKAENKELRFENWEDITELPVLNKSFQLLMYALLYGKGKMENGKWETLVSGIITFRELSAGLKTVRVDGEEMLNASVISRFEEELKELLKNVFDKEQPFEQTDDLKICGYCSFKTICNR